MHIDIIPNRNSKPTVLLRESYRDGKTVRKHTLANLTSLPMDQIDAIRLVLKGEKLVPKEEIFETVHSYHHGHVRAVTLAMEKLGFAKLIDSHPCRERDLVVAMVISRIIDPQSKLATQRAWENTTIPKIFGIEEADEDDLYKAMDWLLARQGRIEKRLADRHLKNGSMALYDLTSSYFEGTHCPLAKFGKDRDGKDGKLQVNYGVLTDDRGCPVSVSVFPGNTSDLKTMMPKVEEMRKEFGLEEFVMVGDRGMISDKQIKEMRNMQGVDWITALRSSSIKNLIEGGQIQLSFFDEKNLFELEHEDYPNERLVACRNPELARHRAKNRESLLESTSKELLKIQNMVKKGRLKTADKIGVRIGRVINKYKVAKHFELTIKDEEFEFSRKEKEISAEAALDGIYVIRTSLPKEKMSEENAVRSYKNLSKIERVFRTMKMIGLKVRPIHHWLEDRVKAHIFLCMLAYYVEWHMLEALRPLLFSDEDQESKKTRDPVKPATRSASALEKIQTKKIDDESEAHSFQTLIKHMSTIVKNICTRKNANKGEPTIEIESTPNEKQQRVFELLKQMTL